MTTTMTFRETPKQERQLRRFTTNTSNGPGKAKAHSLLHTTYTPR